MNIKANLRLAFDMIEAVCLCKSTAVQKKKRGSSSLGQERCRTKNTLSQAVVGQKGLEQIHNNSVNLTLFLSAVPHVDHMSRIWIKSRIFVIISAAVLLFYLEVMKDTRISSLETVVALFPCERWKTQKNHVIASYVGIFFEKNKRHISSLETGVWLFPCDRLKTQKVMSSLVLWVFPH